MKMVLASLALMLRPLIPASVSRFFTPASMLGPLVFASISQFFTNLLNDGLLPFALAAASFFFAWAAILYMSAGTENTRRLEAAKAAFYCVLLGLALALMATTIAGIVNNAATGQ